MLRCRHQFGTTDQRHEGSVQRTARPIDHRLRGHLLRRAHRRKRQRSQAIFHPTS
jgi:hypothetical protein